MELIVDINVIDFDSSTLIRINGERFETFDSFFKASSYHSPLIKVVKNMKKYWYFPTFSNIGEFPYLYVFLPFKFKRVNYVQDETELLSIVPSSKRAEIQEQMEAEPPLSQKIELIYDGRFNMEEGEYLMLYRFCGLEYLMISIIDNVPTLTTLNSGYMIKLLIKEMINHTEFYREKYKMMFKIRSYLEELLQKREREEEEEKTIAVPSITPCFGYSDPSDNDILSDDPICLPPMKRPKMSE
jgi:hypothetical protein